MTDDLSIFYSDEFKDLVQDMRELLSQSNLTILLGAGCSFKAGLPLMSKLTKEVLTHSLLSDESQIVLKFVSDVFAGSSNATIEDYISELVDYLSIVERRNQLGSINSTVLLGNNELSADQLRTALDEIKMVVVQLTGKKDVDVSYHQQFIRSIHRLLQSGKIGRVIDYIVLNYDTLVEDALGLEKISYVDGFAGAATGWWEPSVFQNNSFSARVFKIHGSIEWCLLEGDSLPRRIRKGIKPEASQTHVLIYPASTKYKESQRDPFAQVLKFVRKSLRSLEGGETVLAICGYSFSDSHINFEIETALLQSEGRLTLGAFISDDEPDGVLKKWRGMPSLTDQIRVYSNKGFFHSDRITKSDKDLPWWKFEVLGRLLGGER